MGQLPHLRHVRKKSARQLKTPGENGNCRETTLLVTKRIQDLGWSAKCPETNPAYRPAHRHAVLNRWFFPVIDRHARRVRDVPENIVDGDPSPIIVFRP